MKKSADQNNPYAKLFLASIYFTCKHSYDAKLIKDYIIFAANKNIPEAYLLLGMIYIRKIYKINDDHILLNASSLVNVSLYLFKDIFKKIHDFDTLFPVDIEKGIYYLKLAASQNNVWASIILGDLYFSNIAVKQDLNEAYHFYNIAAKMNNSIGQCGVGIIYIISNNINQGIKYLKLASKQNNPIAQLCLGAFYLDGEYSNKKLKKAIKYFTLAAKGNIIEAQYILGVIYISIDINKAIFYLTQASDKEFGKAQHTLSFLYLSNVFIGQDKPKGINLLLKAVSNNNEQSFFVLGSLYHRGQFVIQDIKKSEKLYRDGSSYKDQYAKNNLAVLYSKGFDDIINKNIMYSIELLKEAITNCKDAVSMYNLAKIYIYEELDNKDVEDFIALLIESLKLHFSPSKYLLCIALVKKIGTDLKSIEYKLVNDYHLTNAFIYEIIEMFLFMKLYDQSIFNEQYEKYRHIEYLYDYLYKPLSAHQFYEKKSTQNAFNITKHFYDGFEL